MISLAVCVLELIFFAASVPRPSGAMPTGASLPSRGCGPLRGCGRQKTRGKLYQYYVANRALGITGRPATGFGRFLGSLRGGIRKYTKRRLRVKTSIFRMDLLKDKYRTLPSARRADFEEAAAEEVTRMRVLREERLARPVPPKTAVADRKAAVADCKPAVADAAAEISLAGLTSTTPLGKHFRLSGGLLGKGSYSTCHAAVETFTGECFCIKFARKAAGDQAALFNEHAFMSRLWHPNVLRVHAMLLHRETSEPRALVLPLLAGNLWELLVKGAADLPLVQKRSLAIQVLAGLEHVHGHGVVHLDLKPDNVLVQPAVAGYTSAVAGYTCCIADFGLAQATKNFKGMAADATTTADAINALEYRPFDLLQLAGRTAVAVHPRHDMWAFGCLLFDVMQSSQRLRDGSGVPLRLMSGVSRLSGPIGEKSRWLLRDSRLGRISEAAAALVRKLQPSGSGERLQLGQKPRRARCLSAGEAGDVIQQWCRVAGDVGSGGRGCGDSVWAF